MKLIALKNHTPDGIRHLKVGEAFEISVSAGNFLIATGRAKRAEDQQTDPAEKKGRYNRRDMRAAS